MFNIRYFVWHIIYTCIFLYLAYCFLFDQANELGSTPAYLYLLFGSMPSIMLIMLAKWYPAMWYKFAMIYGILSAIGILIAYFIGAGFLLFPFLGYAIESVFIYCRR